MQDKAGKPFRGPLFEALQICHSEFRELEKQSFNKRIFLFTNCDEPSNEQDKALAYQRV
jgi:hypothetical protein